MIHPAGAVFLSVSGHRDASARKLSAPSPGAPRRELDVVSPAVVDDAIDTTEIEIMPLPLDSIMGPADAPSSEVDAAPSAALPPVVLREYTPYAPRPRPKVSARAMRWPHNIPTLDAARKILRDSQTQRDGYALVTRKVVATLSRYERDQLKAGADADPILCRGIYERWRIAVAVEIKPWNRQEADLEALSKLIASIDNTLKLLTPDRRAPEPVQEAYAYARGGLLSYAVKLSEFDEDRTPLPQSYGSSWRSPPSTLSTSSFSSTPTPRSFISSRPSARARSSTPQKAKIVRASSNSGFKYKKKLSIAEQNRRRNLYCKVSVAVALLVGFVFHGHQAYVERAARKGVTVTQLPVGVARGAADDPRAPMIIQTSKSATPRAIDSFTAEMQQKGKMVLRPNADTIIVLPTHVSKEIKK